MEYKTLLVEERDHVLTVTLNRPESKNALNTDMWYELATVFEAFDQSEEQWVTIFTHVGNTFCAGADLKAIVAGNLFPPKGYEDRGFGGIASHYFKKPIIGVVDGFALGGGFEFALLCDLLITTKQAQFGLPETMRGLLPSGGGLQRLPRVLPKALALEVIMAGKRLSGEDLYRWGLANYLTDTKEEAMAAGQELAARINAQAPLAVRGCKEIVYQSLDSNLLFPTPDWSIMDKTQAWLATTEDGKEGPRAFAERRAPAWKGR